MKNILALVVILFSSNLFAADTILICTAPDQRYVQVSLYQDASGFNIIGEAIDNYNFAKLACQFKPWHSPVLVCTGKWFGNEAVKLEVAMTTQQQREKWNAVIKRPKSSGGQIVDLACETKIRN